MNQTPRQTSAAFTLIELMISIAIVVVLMIGITKVFSLTSNTAGASNTIGSAIRDARAAQTTFYSDLQNSASDMPFMILRCGTQAAYRNKADQLSDRDSNPLTVDLNGDNKEGDSTVPGEVITASNVNNRNHRVDVFSFFARGLFPRQTGNSTPKPGVYLADMSSQEAWIWYGHLQLANNNGTAYYDPGDTITPTAGKPNDTNQYASDWVLGREAILLKTPTNNQIFDRSGTTSQYYVAQTGTFGYGRGTFSATSGSANYTPFHYLSRTSDNFTMQSSRYDLAGTSISTIAWQLSGYLNWLSTNDPSNSCLWWTGLMSGDRINAANSFPTARFQAKTYVASLNSDDLAYTSPLFIQHCSQFIVEYAGDYLTQDSNPLSATYGQVQNVYTNTNGTDGLIDFVADPVTKTRSIRWYGLPRDVDGDGTIAGESAPGAATAMAKSSDVVPLRDLWMTSTTAAAVAYKNGAPFERNFLTPSPSLTVKSNYAATGGAGMQSTDYYECVWGPSDPKPKMIRITMSIDDPTGKLPDGQTFQYVIQLH